jgi:antitoxin component YwqK of YwqJK toxin-antitoxin module
LKSVSYYVKGIKECEEKNYFYDDMNEQIESIYTYENNVKHGPCKYYHETGELRGVCNYVNNRRIGESKKYYEDGQLAEVSNYVDGFFQNGTAYYYTDGITKTQAIYY